MALTMPYTDPQTGNSYSQAHWIMAQECTNTHGRTLEILCLGFKDKAAHDAGMMPIAYRKFYQVGADFDAAILPVFPVVKKRLYELLLSIKDVPDPTDPTNPAKMTNFFAGAVVT